MKGMMNRAASIANQFYDALARAGEKSCENRKSHYNYYF
jgi:hypothetical protein